MNHSGKIYSSRCWIENKIQPASIKYEAGVITDIHFEKDPEAEDFDDALIMPGVIDVHVHINEPGRTEWEGFETATAAAAAGGITMIIDMPLNSSPVTTSAEAFKIKLEASRNKLAVNTGFYGGLIPGNANHIESLTRSGVLGIKCFLTHSGIDEFPNVTEPDLEIAMPVLAKLNIPLLVHCELSEPCDLAHDDKSYSEYAAGRPAHWEHNAIALMIRLAEKYNCRVHIVHVSSAGSLPLIENAKKRGIKITAETCPHYFLFNSEMIEDGNTIFKCAPPIRDQKNNDALKEGLRSGILNFITTDHSPAPPDIKELESGNFNKAWGGIAGLQFLLSASYTGLKQNMELENIIPLLTSKPAQFLNVADRKGSIARGFDADFVIWDPTQNYIVSESSTLHRHKKSPYTGMTLSGVVKQTIVNGVTVYKDKQIINKNSGQWLLKK